MTERKFCACKQLRAMTTMGEDREGYNMYAHGNVLSDPAYERTPKVITPTLLNHGARAAVYPAPPAAPTNPLFVSYRAQAAQRAELLCRAMARAASALAGPAELLCRSRSAAQRSRSVMCR